MTCTICNIGNDQHLEMLKEFIDQGLSARQMISEMPAPCPYTLRDLSTHRRHMTEKKHEAFKYENGNLILEATGEVVEFIDPKEALRIILTLSVREILKQGGANIGPRYAVEAAKILAELRQDDVLTFEITEAWKSRLKSTAPVATVRTLPPEQTTQYLIDQQKQKEEFLLTIDAADDDDS